MLNGLWDYSRLSQWDTIMLSDTELEAIGYKISSVNMPLFFYSVIIVDVNVLPGHLAV